jgi:hypothetical protein
MRVFEIGVKSEIGGLASAWAVALRGLGKAVQTLAKQPFSERREAEQAIRDAYNKAMKQEVADFQRNPAEYEKDKTRAQFVTDGQFDRGKYLKAFLISLYQVKSTDKGNPWVKSPDVIRALKTFDSSKAYTGNKANLSYIDPYLKKLSQIYVTDQSRGQTVSRQGSDGKIYNWAGAQWIDAKTGKMAGAELP